MINDNIWIEVKNILNAFNEILVETIYDNKEQLITPELLLRFHKLVGKNHGEHFNAIPGQFRNNDVQASAAELLRLAIRQGSPQPLHRPDAVVPQIPLA